MRNEEPCLPWVLDELQPVAERLGAVVAVGVNASTDRSAELARRHGALAGETSTLGYGHGCRAAIQAVKDAGHLPGGYLFVSGDGSNDPHDLPRLVDRHQAGAAMVIGQRTLRWENWGPFGPRRALPNLTLGLLTTVLTARPFCDIGPLRLIDRHLYEGMDLKELVWGWTIEAQILAVRLGARVDTLSVTERPRCAGEQKVSGVSWRRSLSLGLAIAAAGVRTRARALPVYFESRFA